jgi:hypothetical protein
LKKILLTALLSIVLVLTGCRTVYVTETQTTIQTGTTTEKITETTTKISTQTTTETKTLINERNMLTGMAYPAVVYSDTIGHTFGYGLINQGTQSITLQKMEVLDAEMNIIHTVWPSVIQEQFHGGIIPSGEGYYSFVEFEEPYYQLEDVMQWRAEWYCGDAIGNFVIVTLATNPWADEE